MKRIGLIVQRYGEEVNGGAEYHCKVLTEKLAAQFDVEVLTSCAKNHLTWENEYVSGLTEVNGIKVRRFNTPHPRNRKKVRRLLKRLTNRSLMQKIERLFGFEKENVELGDEWSKAQGPFLPELVKYIDVHQAEYDVFIFFTYLYFPTFCGLRVAPQKSILIPTAHDEPAIHLPIFECFFNLPKVILYNTLSEKRLINRLFNNENVYSDIVGVGIADVPLEGEQSASEILKITDAYLIYIGRVDPGKGCNLMIEHFLKFKKLTGNPLKLVLVGKLDMELPSNSDILTLGFVEDKVKVALLKDAKALIMPSYYESLSMVTLESMLEGVVVIANESCEVLKDHIEAGKAGFVFNDFDSFRFAVESVLNDDGLRLNQLKRNARQYVLENYNWPLILDKVNKAINYIQ